MRELVHHAMHFAAETGSNENCQRNHSAMLTVLSYGVMT